MSPAQVQNRALKRRRTSYDELELVKNSEHTGDALTLPAVSAALTNLLQHRRPSDIEREGVEEALSKVKSCLDGLQKKKTLQVDSAVVRNTLRKVAKGKKSTDLFRSGVVEEVTCRKPVRVDVVGSFLLGHASSLLVDVAVQIPADVFHPKDFRAYRYHDKRLLYLLYLARHFLKTGAEQFADISIVNSCLNNDPAKPVLCVTHVEHPDVTIRLLPTYPEDLFVKRHLRDEKVNTGVRPDSDGIAAPLTATISYNASVLMDATLVDNLREVYAVVSTVPAFSDTVSMLGMWCMRHRLYESNFVNAALLVHLIRKGPVPPRASKEHLFRVALGAIIAGKLKTLKVGDLSVCASSDISLLERCEECAGASMLVIENMEAAMDPWFGILPFLFTGARGSKCIPRPLSTLFDGFVRISSGFHNECPFAEDKYKRLLNRAFVGTSRVKRCEYLRPGLYGITLLCREGAHRKVDMRPDSWDAASFKDFWGGKAVVRRFQNGKIVEALVWTGGVQTLQEMASYVFERHCGKQVNVRVILGDLEDVCGLDTQYVNHSSRAMKGFNELASLLRSLEGLVLSIRGVHATSPHLRKCGIPSQQIAQARGVHHTYPLDIVATFESSAAWPDNVVAICVAKASFYVSLKSALSEKGIFSKATISFLDITLAGFVYRLRIKVDKEKALLTADSNDYETVLWETENLVHHHNMISCTRDPLLGSVTRMAKKWLNSHFMLSQLGPRGEELVEVLVAHVVSRPELCERRSVIGYFCQFLHLLAEFPWEVCPLAVFMDDPEEAFSASSSQEKNSEVARFTENVRERFSKKTDGEMAFPVYSVWDDEEGQARTHFTQGYGPEKSVAKVIVASARTALSYIEKYLINEGPEKTLRAVFVPRMGMYDLRLELKKSLVPFQAEKSVHGPFSGSDSLFVGFDTVQMLRNELETRLGDFAMFLTEVCVRTDIFVVWRPQSLQTVKFSLGCAPFRDPVPETIALNPNRDDIVAEMVRLGKGMIVCVHDIRRKEKWRSKKVN